MALAALAAPVAASASVNVNDGVGFVGKGDVQTAMGWNNQKLQDAVNKKNGLSIKFTTQQSASQAISQSAEQTATQTGTQSATQTGTQWATQEMIETLSCTKTHGDVDQRVRVGTRDGERTSTRSAVRVATR